MEKLSPEDISRARGTAQGVVGKIIAEWQGEFTSGGPDAKQINAAARIVAAYSAAENDRLTLERDRLKGALQDMLKLAKMLIRYTSENPSITQGWHTRMDAAEAALRPETEA